MITLKKHINIFIAVLITSLLFTLSSCLNPFAPALSDKEIEGQVLSDQKSIDGVFENFKLAYLFKDTTIYGRLLDDDFDFIFRNYDKSMDVSWGREEDMITTHRLFNATQNLDLIWNDVIVSSGDSVLQEISRDFSLTIYFSSNDIVNIQGKAVFDLTRPDTSKPWKITKWRDESNY